MERHPVISDARMEKALTYLAETDEAAAELRAEMERAEYRIKSLKSTVFKMSEGTVAERNAMSESHENVLKAYSDHCDAIKAYHAMANKRTTEELVTQVWRSINANRRQG